MKIRMILMLFSVAALVISCSPSTGPTDSSSSTSEDLTYTPDIVNVNSKQAEDIALKIVYGFVIKIKKEVTQDSLAWKAEIKTFSGSVVVVYISVSNGKVIKIESSKGPFNYEINIRNAYIKLSKAIALAIQQLNGNIYKWEIKFDSGYWYYEIKVKAKKGKYKIKIHAKSGKMIKKCSDNDNDEGNDNDNDGD